MQAISWITVGLLLCGLSTAYAKVHGVRCNGSVVVCGTMLTEETCTSNHAFASSVGRGYDCVWQNKQCINGRSCHL